MVVGLNEHRLRVEMFRRGVTYKQLAGIIGTTPKTLRMKRRGETRITLVDLVLIKNALGVDSIDSLVRVSYEDEERKSAREAS